MKTHSFFFICFTFMFLTFSFADAETAPGLNLIPKPLVEKQGQGIFKINSKTLILFSSENSEMERLANYFSYEINKASTVKVYSAPANFSFSVFLPTITGIAK